jgi:hypothetical protein
VRKLLLAHPRNKVNQVGKGREGKGRKWDVERGREGEGEGEAVDPCPEKTKGYEEERGAGE